jgi:hypothetical protein
MPEETIDIALSSTAKKLEKKQKFQAVFDNEEGRWVLGQILSMSNAFDSLDVVDNNPYMTYLQLGQRRLALSIAREVFQDDRYLLELMNQMERKLNE